MVWIVEAMLYGGARALAREGWPWQQPDLLAGIYAALEGPS